MLLLTIFSLAAAVAQVLLVRRALARLAPKDDSPTGPPLPGVTVIKPIYGLEEDLAENLRSWLHQQYPGPVQFIFSLQDPDDPALPVARSLQDENPHLDIHVIVNPVLPGLSGKASNLFHAAAISRHPILIFSDSDIVAPPGALRALAAPVAAEPRRALAAVPIPLDSRGLGGAFMTLSVYMAVVIAWLGSMLVPGPLRRQTGFPGGTVVLTRQGLADVGGVTAFGSHITEDLKLGRLLFAHGYTPGPGATVDLLIGRPPFLDFWHLTVRGNRGLWGLAPGVYLFWLVVGFWHYAAAALGLLLGHTHWVFCAAAFVAARTVLLGLFIASIRPATAWTALFYPIFEAVNLAATLWAPATMGRAVVTWRGIQYRLSSSGEIRHIVNSTGEAPPP